MPSSRTRAHRRSRSERRARRITPSSNWSIPVRRLEVDPSTVQVDRWLVPHDPYFSHFLATLSAVFPRGEDFFVDSVRRFRTAVADDPVLKAQVKGFIGQEAMHGREHRALNARFAELGYRTPEADAAIGRACDRILAMRPPTLAIAATAAAEHFTGVFAEVALTHEPTRELLFGQPEIEPLIMWHALEELEHKNVAFDVMRASGAGYPTQIAGFALTTSVLAATVVIQWVSALLEIRGEITWAHRRQFLRDLGRQRLLHPWFVLKVLGYLRPGFHPDDTNTDALVEEWRDRLTDMGVVTVTTGGRAAA